MTNARITEISDGINTELIAEQTHLMYEPATQGCVVSYQYRPQLYVNGEARGPAGDWQVLRVDLAAIASRCYGNGTDPITGADLSQISTAGVAAIIKASFDTAFNENAAQAASGDDPTATGSPA